MDQKGHVRVVAVCYLPELLFHSTATCQGGFPLPVGGFDGPVVVLALFHDASDGTGRCEQCRVEGTSWACPGLMEHALRIYARLPDGANVHKVHVEDFTAPSGMSRAELTREAVKRTAAVCAR